MTRMPRTHRGPVVVTGIVLAAVLGTHVATAQTRTYDPTNPADALKIEQRHHCSLTDGKPAWYWFPGNVYSRVPGEPDRLLFRVHGWSARACKTFNDPVRGYGYRAVNRELLIYEDAETGQILRTWKNPWTGEVVEVMHVANDPVSMREPVFERDKEGKPIPVVDRGFILEGYHFTGGGAARLYYKNPLGGEYQEHVGGWYHSMEAGTNAMPVSRRLDATLPEFGRTLTWMRVSKWLPWMKMGDRPGVIYYHTAGTRVESLDELPEAFRQELRTNYALWLEAPPLDDTRPNMTSWIQFQRLIESRRQQPRPEPEPEPEP